MNNSDEIEIQNLLNATEYLSDFLTKYQKKTRLYITKGLVLNIHKLLLAHIPEYAGRYRTATDEITINGSFTPVHVGAVDFKMNDLFFLINNRRKWYSIFKREILNKIKNSLNKKEIDFIYRVFTSWYIHHQLVLIHPFCDGNGRIARVIMCLILRDNRLSQSSFPPLINFIINRDKSKYLNSLSASDHGDYI